MLPLEDVVGLAPADRDPAARERAVPVAEVQCPAQAGWDGAVAASLVPDVVAAAQPGSQATLKLLRNGSPVAFKLSVGKRPKPQRPRE